MQLPKIRYQTRNFRGENPSQQGLKSRNRDFTDIKGLGDPILSHQDNGLKQTFI